MQTYIICFIFEEFLLYLVYVMSSCCKESYYGNFDGS